MAVTYSKFGESVSLGTTRFVDATFPLPANVKDHYLLFTKNGVWFGTGMLFRKPTLELPPAYVRGLNIYGARGGMGWLGPNDPPKEFVDKIKPSQTCYFWLTFWMPHSLELHGLFFTNKENHNNAREMFGKLRWLDDVLRTDPTERRKPSS